jgi:3-oxoacyl-[acyl-carrier protein] reductase
MDLQLTGKTALITGASKGIGKAVAEGFAAEGVHVHLAARTAADLDAAAEGIRKRYNVSVTTHALDLSTQSGIDRLGAACRDVDILVNNAGAIPSGGLLDIDDKTLRQAWELKLFGFINLTRHVYAAMVARKSGVIVNVIGGAATNPRPTYVAGAMANSALDAFTVAMGKGSQAHGVRVVGVHPGLTATDRQEFLLGPQAEKKFGDRTRWRELIDPKTVPFGRPAEPEEVADMVVFLASERASHTSGVVVSMTGGV